jgi:hypothetical protein
MQGHLPAISPLFTELPGSRDTVEKVGVELVATTILAPNVPKAARLVPDLGRER